MSIQSIKARKNIESRGNPTIEVDLVTDKGSFRAAVPSGASTGNHEAHEMMVKDPKAYHGKGVTKAVDNMNKVIAPALAGKTGQGYSYNKQQYQQPAAYACSGAGSGSYGQQDYSQSGFGYGKQSATDSAGGYGGSSQGGYSQPGDYGCSSQAGSGRNDQGSSGNEMGSSYNQSSGGGPQRSSYGSRGSQEGEKPEHVFTLTGTPAASIKGMETICHFAKKFRSADSRPSCIEVTDEGPESLVLPREKLLFSLEKKKRVPMDASSISHLSNVEQDIFQMCCEVATEMAAGHPAGALHYQRFDVSQLPMMDPVTQELYDTDTVEDGDNSANPGNIDHGKRIEGNMLPAANAPGNQDNAAAEGKDDDDGNDDGNDDGDGGGPGPNFDPTETSKDKADRYLEAIVETHKLMNKMPPEAAEFGNRNVKGILFWGNTAIGTYVRTFFNKAILKELDGFFLSSSTDTETLNARFAEVTGIAPSVVIVLGIDAAPDTFVDWLKQQMATVERNAIAVTFVMTATERDDVKEAIRRRMVSVFAPVGDEFLDDEEEEN